MAKALDRPGEANYAAVMAGSPPHFISQDGLAADMPPPAEATSRATHEAGFLGHLESLRGVCALAIVVIHFPFATHMMTLPGAHQAWLFVDLFFVLSGFVIAHVYLRRIDGPAAAGRFAIKRFFRLYPLHIATTAAMAVLLLARFLTTPDTVARYGIDSEFWRLAVANVFLVQSWLLSDRTILNTASWSISTEFLAYLLFALVCLGIRSERRRVGAVAGLVVLALLAMLAFEHAELDGDQSLRVIRCIYGFGLGVLAWRASLSLRIGRIANVALQIAASLCLIGLLPATEVVPSLTLLFPVVTFLLVAAMAVDHGSWLRRAWEWGPVRHLGRLSFSIYLVHGPVITFASAVLHARPGLFPLGGWGGDAFALVLIAATIGISELTFRWIEVPSRRLGQHLAARVGRAPSTSPAAGPLLTEA